MGTTCSTNCLTLYLNFLLVLEPSVSLLFYYCIERIFFYNSGVQLTRPSTNSGVLILPFTSEVQLKPSKFLNLPAWSPEKLKAFHFYLFLLCFFLYAYLCHKNSLVNPILQAVDRAINNALTNCKFNDFHVLKYIYLPKKKGIEVQNAKKKKKERESFLFVFYYHMVGFYLYRY